MKKNKKMLLLPLTMCLSVCVLTGCQNDNAQADVSTEEPVYVAQNTIIEIELEDEAVALASSPATHDILLMPSASGLAVKKSDKAVIDYSNTKDGYVMVQFTAATDKRLKVQVAGPTTTYTYDLPVGTWTTFPLSDGNGNYKVTVLENTTQSKYAVVLAESFAVSLSDEFAPFIRPNQYVDYEQATNTVKKAAELTVGITEPLDKVEKIYDFVVNHLTYDKEKAATVKSGYLPVLDSVLSSGKGICFDYASLMTGMLRSQGVPCKLVVGYAGSAYHAWISVWTEETGWVDGVIFFDGTTWQRMDPTFASSSQGSEAVMEYIGDGKNYTTKYLY